MLPSFSSAGASGLETGWTPLGKDGCVWIEVEAAWHPPWGMIMVYGGASPPPLSLETSLFQMSLISHPSGPWSSLQTSSAEKQEDGMWFPSLSR